jgi:glycosyltransferase XagB
MPEQTDWELMAANLLKAELKRKGVTYAQLGEKLIGISDKEVNIRNKLSRGSSLRRSFCSSSAARCWKLGGWDAHNVTEDADLGIRLARHGYRTELIDTVTGEEANCRPLPWIKQRSRWIKGYMMTWAVHMRDPRLLWRQLGPRAFLGFQVMFLGTIAQFLLAPLLWSFLLVPSALTHLAGRVACRRPRLGDDGRPSFLSETRILHPSGRSGIRRTARLSAWWVPTLKAYFPLASLAAYKALLELATRPFYWDKTTHGLFDQRLIAD